MCRPNNCVDNKRLEFVDSAKSLRLLIDYLLQFVELVNIYIQESVLEKFLHIQVKLFYATHFFIQTPVARRGHVHISYKYASSEEDN